MKDQSFLPVIFKVPDLTPLQQAHIQEVLWGQTELAAARARYVGLLEIIQGFSSWPRRMIFIRRLRRL